MGFTSSMPLLFTVRSAGHGGKFRGTEEEYLDLLRLGLSLGVELLDVECKWSDEGIDEIATFRGETGLVGSFCDISRPPQPDDLRQLFQSCNLRNQAAVARVVISGATREDCWLVQKVGAE